jgi:small-conductance mechanosensitive channel
LEGVARRDARVLVEPPPSVVFMGFGESSLDFDLRVFLAGPEQVMQVRHDLNVAIDAALREAGIEIPFPQRVVHLRGEAPREVGGEGKEAARPSPGGERP